VVATGPDFASARAQAYEGLAHINLEGSHYRTDIAAKVSN
jgi:phosphoribosylamine--glycine ligase